MHVRVVYITHLISKLRIIPESAHSAYDKAAQYFNIKLWRVPVDKEFQADVKAIRKFINRNTILVCNDYNNSFAFPMHHVYKGNIL